MKFIKILGIFLIFQLYAQNQVDFIIFSYDRPLQLYALLESTYRFVNGLNEIFVIYRSSDADFESGYQLVKQDFPKVRYLRQGSNPAGDFKQLTIEAFHANDTPYVLFGVDDIVVKDEIDLDDVIVKMEFHNAYGFYLRLGVHLDFCYTWSTPLPLPSARAIDGIYIWRFSQGVYEWGYPHTVDMTVYRKRDIYRDVFDMYYATPNNFEGTWAGRSGSIMYRSGICYRESKMVNLPLNKVNHSGNRAMNSLTVRDLLKIFSAGYKMDITPLVKIQNKSAHMEYEPTFVMR